MSALQPLPTAALPNATLTLPVSWGESWAPTEVPFSPSPPQRRRKRRGGPVWRDGEGGRVGQEGKDVKLNASVIAELLNLTAEDVDYIFNMSTGGGYPWMERSRESAVEYVLNSRKHRHNASFVQRQRNKNGKKSTEPCYCGSSESLFRRMLLAYRPLHPVAALTVCVLGTLANALNVAVLTRPHLAPAPVNRILTAIAAADAALMAEYAVFIILIPHSKAVKVENSPKLPPMTPAEEAARAERDYSFAAAAFVLFHMHFSQVLHTVSICLTLTLAVWRLLALRLPPERARTLCSRRRCSVALAISLLLPPLLCSPAYLVFGITTTHVTMGGHHPQPIAQEDFSITPIEYTLDPGFLLPTAAMSLDEREEELSTHSPSPEGSTEQGEWASTPRGEGEAPNPWTPFPASHPPPVVAVLYHLDLSNVAKDQEMLYITIFWVYAVMLKLIPCFVLTVISVWLVRTLCRAKSRRRTLQSQGEVKKSSQNKAPLQIRWRKTDEKTALSIANRSIPPPPPTPTPAPPAPQKQKPLDDGGVWMGREEEKVGEATEEEDQKPDEPPSAEEEEVVTLVRVEKPPESDGEASTARDSGLKGFWLWGLARRRWERRSTEVGEGSLQQQNAAAVVGAAVRRRRRRTERTTRMLVAVLVLFLVTEFPQGVLGLMSGLFGRCFFRNCYHIFGDLMDLLALLNGSINFILYCAMSRQFRQTFAQLFCKHPKLLWTYFCKKYPDGQNKDMEIMKNGNMGGEGHKKVGAATVGQTSQTMGEVQSTYV